MPTHVHTPTQLSMLTYEQLSNLICSELKSQSSCGYTIGRSVRITLIHISINISLFTPTPLKSIPSSSQGQVDSFLNYFLFPLASIPDFSTIDTDIKLISGV